MRIFCCFYSKSARLVIKAIDFFPEFINRLAHLEQNTNTEG